MLQIWLVSSFPKGSTSCSLTPWPSPPPEWGRGELSSHFILTVLTYLFQICWGPLDLRVQFLLQTSQPATICVWRTSSYPGPSLPEQERGKLADLFISAIDDISILGMSRPSGSQWTNGTASISDVLMLSVLVSTVPTTKFLLHTEGSSSKGSTSWSLTHWPSLPECHAIW